MARTLADLDWPRHTERLSLRPATPTDLRAVYEIRSLPEVAHWMPDSPTSYDAWLVRQGRTGGVDKMLVVLLDDVVIGHLHLDVADGWSQAEVRELAAASLAEIGWAFDPSRQGQGFATESVRELIRICFEDLGVRRVTALAFADNLPSLKVMERVGMRREALLLKESLHRELGWLDGVSYGLLADEWRT